MAEGKDPTTAAEEFVVGGIRIPRPFRIRRLGHFGVNVADPEVSKKFYCDLLGFRLSDPLDFGPRIPEEKRAAVGPTVGWFTRHGTDHHSFVFFPRKAHAALNPWIADYPQATVNQITWQVNTLAEVSNGFDWFKKHGKKIARAGRDLPGSNWHFYPFDPDGHVNELYYGIEQVGWDGLSKPKPMYGIRYTEPPPLPHKSEMWEVEEAKRQGVDLTTGTVAQDSAGEETYDVGGILIARPFKIQKVGPVRIFVNDVDRALAFYRDDLGLTVTEEVTWRGHRCVFLRANTEHHSLAVYPIGIRSELGLSGHTTLMSCGVQVGSYQQLKDAVSFLKSKGQTIKYLPPELFPGIDYSAFVIDPDGHAIQLYYYMEQLGWDGRPRPANQRPVVDNANWPDVVLAYSDTFTGEPFLGPVG